MGKVKQKTHKGAAKRFRVTAKGKVKCGAGNRGHLMSSRSGERKLRLRKGKVIQDSKIASDLLRMLGKD